MTELHVIHKPKVGEESVWVELDQEALLHNLSEINRSTLPGTEVLAVVKANAYGHCLSEVARCLDGKTAYFGVASVDEALSLRRLEIESPVLLFCIPFRDAAEA